MHFQLNTLSRPEDIVDKERIGVSLKAQQPIARRIELKTHRILCKWVRLQNPVLKWNLQQIISTFD